MSLLSWNCRGLGQPQTVRVLKEMVKSLKPGLLFLSETLVEDNKIELLASNIGFTNFFSVDRQGWGGGLAVFWKNNMQCSVLESSNNHIDLVIRESNSLEWRLTCFYGYPERERRQQSWDLLRFLASRSQLPWCVFGDFNDLLSSKDKKGKHSHPQRLMNGFKRAVEDYSLVEVDLKGGDFTWEKSKGTTDWVQERLDRAFATNSWWHNYPLCTLTVSHVVRSDHDPIHLELFNTKVSRRQFRFKFENTWLRESSFHEEVNSVLEQPSSDSSFA